MFLAPTTIGFAFWWFLLEIKKETNMTEYNFFADLLNKYSQFTPWVQVALGISLTAIILGIAYFTKGIMDALFNCFKPKDTKQS